VLERTSSIVATRRDNLFAVCGAFLADHHGGVDAPADAPVERVSPILTATAVCRRAPSMKTRISINKWEAWLFRSDLVCLILFTMFTDLGYPSTLDQWS